MARIAIRPGTLRDVTFVAAGMREADWREISAVTDETRLGVGALSYLAAPDFCWTAWLVGSPVAAFGFAPAGVPGVWSAWAFGTERMHRAVPAVSRFGREVAAPLLVAAGVRRVEVRSLAGHDLAHRWLAGLGARREAECRDYGRSGETFVLYAWTLSEWTHVPCAQDAPTCRPGPAALAHRPERDRPPDGAAAAGGGSARPRSDHPHQPAR